MKLIIKPTQRHTQKDIQEILPPFPPPPGTNKISHFSIGTDYFTWDIYVSIQNAFAEILLRYHNSHLLEVYEILLTYIKFIFWKYTIQFPSFSIFTEWYNNYHDLTVEYFYPPKQSSLLKQTPFPLLPSPRQSLIFVSVYLPILDLSYKWKFTVHQYVVFCTWYLSFVLIDEPQ